MTLSSMFTVHSWTEGDLFWSLMLTFEDRRGFQDLLLYPGVLPADGSEELQNQLCALSLPSSRLTAAS